jgi:GAF domain-containing protein
MSGHEQAARKAEVAALRIDVALDEPKVARRLLQTARTVRETTGRSLQLERLLDGAIALVDADLGNIQVAERGGRSLRIVRHSGFGEAFLEHFAAVTDETSACGRAARGGTTVVIGDVQRDAGFAPHRAVAAESGFRAVQSTPVAGRDGSLVAVVSTHFREPHRPSSRELLLFGWYVDQVGDVFGRAA